ncbi:hypothetical protein [Silanimonas sp.]|jgi:hypothetical protein|uniref:hypothetical protein n=1 Tax=Silanimonas sp. TaxID=1929290 RepID=UPI0022C9FE01|nr:hypothetical protein [Silanimonas sp.]MCZ8167453.1 hypothetical protein [Silanimonas sp.]
MTTPLIAFLDTLGRLPPMADFESRVAALDVDTPIREALMGRDAGALARAFGDSAPYWCGILAPEDEPKPIDDVPGDEPAREPDERPGPDPAS